MSGNLEFLLPILLPLVGGGIIASCKKLNRTLLLRILVLIILLASAISVFMINFTPQELRLELFEFSADFSFMLKVDEASSFFSVITTVLWIVVALYSFEYIKHEEREQQFFGFYLMTYGAIMGIDYSGNLITFYLFFEFMTLCSLPLVLHNRKKESISAALKYLLYSLCGAFMSLLGILFISKYVYSTEFVEGGFFTSYGTMANKELLVVVLFIIIVGFAIKAGIFPLHGWLPTAHPQAPAPASAVLSGLITKVGVFGVIRVVYYVCGEDYLRNTWAQYTLLTLAAITIVMGSMMAYREKELKKRLAFSTVSQVSYILFGIFLLTIDGYRGAMMHVYFHAIIKVTLFLTAGIVIFKTGKKDVDDLKNIGRTIPITMICFTVSSLGLVGIPPTSGFISKWFLATGSLYSNLEPISWIGAVALLLSAVLTAGYLLVPAFMAFFAERKQGDRLKREKVSPFMTMPVVFLSSLTVIFGVANGGILGVVDRMVSTIF